MLQQCVGENELVNNCCIVSELQLCVSKLQPLVDVCCAVLLKNDIPNVTALLQSNG